MKRIVLCFDGTWNTPADDGVADDQRVETNVSRFHRSITSAGPDGVVQDPWYNAGVGTGLFKLTGAAFGAGLDKHIIDGYRHLVDTYEAGDEVFVLGFSRGAYTARSLVGMIRNCGLVKPGRFSELQIGMAFGIYRTRHDGPDSATATAFRRSFGREIRINFLGVWDTVGALGIPLRVTNKLDAALYQFHDTKLSGIVDRAYHAVAVDEHRQDYAVTLWDPDAARPAAAFEQRWFPGAHADVGGGYDYRRLPDLSLRWMQDRAAAAGLGVALVTPAADAALGKANDSYADFLKGVYAKTHARFLRPMLATGFGNEVVDASVAARRADPGLGYSPGNPGFPV